ncbi:MAG: DUF933 domain-containing protein [Phycisphaerae bacterium]|nr:DUF933 domain-containing protein [Phycisphaerae bacterium]
MKIALAGLPFSGKTTLLRSLIAGGRSAAGTRPDAESVAMVKVPDPRLDKLTEIFKPRKKVPAQIEFVDVPGLGFDTDAARTESARHLPILRQADALVVVLRAFEGGDVFAYRDRVDPQADWRELHSEFLLSDLQTITNRIDKVKVSLTKPNRTKAMEHELALLQRCVEALENEKPLSGVLTADEEKELRSFGLLTQKSIVVVRNLGENQLASPPPVPDEMRNAAAEVLDLAATLEAELADLGPEEEETFLKEYGLTEPAVNRLARACLAACRMIVFLTYGEDECRAWPIAAGADAVTAAGAIHSDLARGFIRAEIVHWQDFADHGDIKGCRDAGKFKLEGKSYLMQDGDLVVIRFAV